MSRNKLTEVSHTIGCKIPLGRAEIVDPTEIGKYYLEHVYAWAHTYFGDE